MSSRRCDDDDGRHRRCRGGVVAMSTATTEDQQSRTDELARLSPLVLLAVAMPWLLEWGIIQTVSVLAPAYEPLVMGRFGDAFLYPVVTGSIVLVGLYALLDPAARRALFLFRRPSWRELLAAAVAPHVAKILSTLAVFVVISAFGVNPPSNPVGELGIRSIAIFVVVGGIFAPIVEEVLFRGLLLGYLVERGVPKLVAAGVVITVFGAIHYYAGPASVASAAVMGAILVALRLRYDNLVSPVLVHSFSNLINVLVVPLLS